MTRPLLLHSLAELRSLILPLLDAVGPRRLVELGGEGGLLTSELADWAAAHGAELHCVEPFPSQRLLHLEQAGRLRLTRAKSPAALADLPAFDLAIVDGDHNWHVVTGELSALFGAGAAEWPVAILHDVCWPAGRRDQYYDPDDVPAAERQPHAFEGGAVLGEPELQELGGFHGAGAFAFATREGGPRNGVLTAVEDFMAAHGHLRLHVVPVVFGMGVLLDARAPFAGRVAELLAPFDRDPLLERLERNRLDLYLAVLRLEAERERAEAAARRRAEVPDAVVAGLSRELERVQAENHRLRLELTRASTLDSPAAP